MQGTSISIGPATFRDSKSWERLAQPLRILDCTVKVMTGLI